MILSIQYLFDLGKFVIVAKDKSLSTRAEDAT